jgi:uncharacterized protein YlxP (DUF503 family)
MVVGRLEVELHLPGSSSLKEKRFVIRSLVDRLRHRLNVAVSETDHHDLWQRATLGIVTVSNEAKVVHSVLSHAQRVVEREPRAVVIDVHVEVE